MSIDWQFVAQQAVQRFSTRIRMPSVQDERLCLACSGGADSVGLVLIFAGMFPVNQLAIVHYNHNTRGTESDADAAFAQAFTEALNIPFFVEKRASGVCSENALRQDRYVFFEKVLKKIGSRYLVTAHHANDLVETMLMRLLRGSSEIAAPKSYQKFKDYIRIHPLLGIRKREIVDFLVEHKIPWREDSTNNCNNYLRNRIRFFLKNFDDIPRLNHWEEGFVLAHQYLEEDSACLDSLAQSYVPRGEPLDLSQVFHSALVRRVLHDWIQQPLTRTCFETILNHLDSPTPFTVTITPQLELIIQQRIITKKIKKTCVPYEFNHWTTGTLYLPNGHLMRQSSTRTQISENPDLNQTCIFLDPDCSATINIRTWQPGDHYRPFQSHEKSLKKLFSDRKIPREKRHLLPVLCDPNGLILWVPGLPPADFAQVRGEFATKLTFSST